MRLSARLLHHTMFRSCVPQALLLRRALLPWHASGGLLPQLSPGPLQRTACRPRSSGWRRGRTGGRWMLSVGSGLRLELSGLRLGWFCCEATRCALRFACCARPGGALGVGPVWSMLYRLAESPWQLPLSCDAVVNFTALQVGPSAGRGHVAIHSLVGALSVLCCSGQPQAPQPGQGSAGRRHLAVPGRCAPFQ